MKRILVALCAALLSAAVLRAAPPEKFDEPRFAFLLGQGNDIYYLVLDQAGKILISRPKKTRED
jgi:hypothetical protein